MPTLPQTTNPHLPSSSTATSSIATSATSPRQPLAAKFKTYLVSQNRSAATIKNYVSDVDQFLGWLAHNLQEDILEARQLTQTAFGDYARFIADPANRIHPATANRYLSSLRAFGEFLVKHNLIAGNPALELKNQTVDPTIDQVVSEFRHELERQKLSASTIKNYVSDVKNYLIWASTNVKTTDSKSELLS